jgi:hypothetical protein
MDIGAHKISKIPNIEGRMHYGFSHRHKRCGQVLEDGRTITTQPVGQRLAKHAPGSAWQGSEAAKIAMPKHKAVI